MYFMRWYIISCVLWCIIISPTPEKGFEISAFFSDTDVAISIVCPLGDRRGVLRCAKKCLFACSPMSLSRLFQ